MDVTYSAAGQTAPDFTAICANTSTCDYGTENFTGWTGTSPFISTFTDAGAGTYFASRPAFPSPASIRPGRNPRGPAANGSVCAQNRVSAVYPARHYPELYGGPAVGATNVSTYTLTLSATGVPGVNYFGVWISALDPFNDLKLYDGNTVVAEFNSRQPARRSGHVFVGVEQSVLRQPDNRQFNGQDWQELFAYVNVFDLSGFITSVVFSDSGNTGFESSNDAVAYVNPIHSVGTLVVAGPRTCLGRSARHGPARSCAYSAGRRVLRRRTAPFSSAASIVRPRSRRPVEREQGAVDLRTARHAAIAVDRFVAGGVGRHRPASGFSRQNISAPWLSRTVSIFPQGRLAPVKQANNRPSMQRICAPASSVRSSGGIEAPGKQLFESAD